MTTFRNGHQLILASARDDRSPDRIIAHYELERELSDRLRNAPRAERPVVYGHIYSELFERLEDHPQRTASSDAASARVSRELRIVAPLLSPSSTFVEIGCGDGALCIAAAHLAKISIGIDVTGALIPSEKPDNFRFILTDGVMLDVESASVDFVYSNQVIEHLHPDDARDQLVEVRRILKPGGRYICITPNCASGPHDVSKYFDEVATGFHIREYNYASLKTLFEAAGFRRFRAMVVFRGHRLPVPYLFARAAEILVSKFPTKLRTRIHTSDIARVLLGLNAIATA